MDGIWIIILIKLFIMFVILKLFFFKDFLSFKFSTDKEKSDYVINVLTNNKINSDKATLPLLTLLTLIS